MTFVIIAITLSLLSLCWQTFTIGRRLSRLEADTDNDNSKTLNDALAKPCVVCDHKNGYHELVGCNIPECRCRVSWRYGKLLETK